MTSPCGKALLTNGVRVLTEHVPAARSLSIGVLVEASPQDDPADRLGLAHFAEHAFFQGTAQRDALAIARWIDEAGGQMGAFTGRDYTCFYANVLRDYGTYALELLGDILLNSTFPADNLARERDAIQREIQLSHDNPADALHDELKAAVWRNHPLGRPICGTADSVGRLTRDDVLEFAAANYTGPRIIVAAAGAIDDVCFVEQTQDSLWRLPDTASHRDPSRCPFESVALRHERDLTQAYFCLALPTSAFQQADRYAMHVLNCILGGGMSSRLFRSLREQRGLVYHVQSENHTYRDAGVLMIEGSTSPDHLADVLSLTLIECARLFTADLAIDEEELWKAKMQIKGQHQLAADSMHTRMSRLATQEFYFGRHITEAEIVAGIEGVDLVDLERLFATTLLPAMESVSLACAGPVGLPSQLTIEGLLEDFRQLTVGHTG